MGNSTNKSIADHEKKKEHEGFGEEDHKHESARGRERKATEEERRAVKDVTEAPRQ